MSDKTYIVTSSDAKIGTENFRSQATTEAGKVFGVKSDGTVGLISSAKPAADDSTIEYNSDDKLQVKAKGLDLDRLKSQATTEAGKVIGVNDDGTIGLLSVAKVDNISIAYNDSSELTIPEHGVTLNRIAQMSTKDVGKSLGVLESGNVGLISCLPLTGGTMAGTIDVNSNRITNVPAPSDITDAVNRDYVDTKAGDYLPLSGGAMTGDIEMTNNLFIKDTSDAGYIVITGGTSMTSGSWIRVTGKDQANKGAFAIVAHDGTNYSRLDGTPAGVLTWGGNNVITSAGGNMTGALICHGSSSNAAVILNDSDSTGMSICGGTGTSNSSRLVLMGKSKGSYGGNFYLYADDDTTQVALKGTPAGSLTWNGKEVCTQGSVTVTATKTSYCSAMTLNGYRVGNLYHIWGTATGTVQLGTEREWANTFTVNGFTVASKNTAVMFGAANMDDCGNVINAYVSMAGKFWVGSSTQTGTINIVFGGVFYAE